MSPTFQFRRFAASHEALGVLVDFVATKQPFDQFPSGKLVVALKHQIANGNHVCAFAGEALVGYCGWIPITQEMGQLWLANRAELKPVPAAQADGLAVSIVCADDPGVVRGLIRQSRKLNIGRRAFFKREYAGGARAVRLQQVYNVWSDAPLRAGTP
jgi:hypothetical protein